MVNSSSTPTPKEENPPLPLFIQITIQNQINPRVFSHIEATRETNASWFPPRLPCLVPSLPLFHSHTPAQNPRSRSCTWHLPQSPFFIPILFPRQLRIPCTTPCRPGKYSVTPAAHLHVCLATPLETGYERPLPCVQPSVPPSSTTAPWSRPYWPGILFSRQAPPPLSTCSPKPYSSFPSIDAIPSRYYEIPYCSLVF